MLRASVVESMVCSYPLLHCHKLRHTYSATNVSRERSLTRCYAIVTKLARTREKEASGEGGEGARR